MPCDPLSASALRRVRLLRTWGPALLTASLLVAIGVDAAARERRDVTVRHGRVREVAKSVLPYSVGDWLGSEIDPPEAAVALLRPNVLAARAYRNLRTGETADLLFVHCSDARDLLGHYPPVCFPAHGYVALGAATRDWDVAGTSVRGRRYRFRAPADGREIVVDNFMVLPSGAFAPDMDAVNRLAGDARQRGLGVAEVQVVTDARMTDARRDEVFEDLVAPNVPLLTSVGADPDHE